VIERVKEDLLDSRPLPPAAAISWRCTPYHSSEVLIPEKNANNIYSSKVNMDGGRGKWESEKHLDDQKKR